MTSIAGLLVFVVVVVVVLVVLVVVVVPKLVASNPEIVSYFGADVEKTAEDIFGSLFLYSAVSIFCKVGPDFTTVWLGFNAILSIFWIWEGLLITGWLVW